ncbi:MAG: sensor histidine kinase [gamma proteobacterium symbiont of Bathyaustriella thionipta]|nr:sensor histidine kinase [gamma proteobacterium symbiont of Bathyaustriella thionipta]MCU7949716.1 sensor histidine kinase [gamma proteobacterium symbiont of Bathyaustriella thionipta]MCU7952918.1 sensor histidine kinase [gamma proteobacterium symbiont of Bathyaustriella thionipta]MCU7956422.1 sensor histidine kinase [gamma proteobacterium symbiont of Bathyaustriella thionipta]MCU7967535.1 sensor histidine kinase [gamma proteobacterium symbiont of Bathyaustriella thionipta]
MKSLSIRLQLSLSISLILLVSIVGYVSHQALYKLTRDAIYSRLEHDAESLLGALTLENNTADNKNLLTIKHKRLSQIYQQPFSGHYFTLHLSNGRIINSRSLWDFNLQQQLSELSLSQSDIVNGPEHEQLLIFSNSYNKYGYSFTLYVAEDIKPILNSVDLFINKLILLAVGSLILLIVIQTQVIRRTFQQLAPLQQDIKQLEKGEIDKLSEDVPTEIQPLVIEINYLLKQLSLRLERSRNALGNLSHALKGPLNLLLQYFDSDPAQQTTNRQLAHQQTSRIQILMERELKRARLAGNGFSSIRFNAANDLSDLIALLQQIYAHKNLDIQLKTAPDLPCFGDREDILELMGNLLDNACKWARTTVDCQITFNKSIKISIEDDGAGISHHDIEQLTQRGTRLDETIEGHGLGLAIAKDIIKLYNGKITFSSSPLGGLQVQIIFPE